MPYRKALCRRLPATLAAQLSALDEESARQLEEIRIYAGRAAEMIICGRRKPIACVPDMGDVLAALSAYALYSCESQMAEGYIPLPDGHRAGVCGRLTRGDDGRLHMSGVTSVCIRIARHAPGASRGFQPFLLDSDGKPARVLLLGAPGCGKTTALRDAVIWLAAEKGFRVAVADEREELFASSVPCAIDVLAGAQKAQAFSMLLRSMSPQVIAGDELGSPEDAEAVLDAARCGVGMLFTAHAGSMREAARRATVRRLMEEGVFDWMVLLGRHGSVLCVRDAHGKEWEGERLGQLGCGSDGDDCGQHNRLSAFRW